MTQDGIDWPATNGAMAVKKLIIFSKVMYDPPSYVQRIMEHCNMSITINSSQKGEGKISAN